MPVRSHQAPGTGVRPGLQRRIIHGEHLMTAVLDFSDGPWAEPEPPHAHPHEQITYIASGSITFYCEGEPPQDLQAGDLFFVPSGRSHSIRLNSAEARLVDSFTPLRDEFL